MSKCEKCIYHDRFSPEYAADSYDYCRHEKVSGSDDEPKCIDSVNIPDWCPLDGKPEKEYWWEKEIKQLQQQNKELQERVGEYVKDGKGLYVGKAVEVERLQARQIKGFCKDCKKCDSAYDMPGISICVNRLIPKVDIDEDGYCSEFEPKKEG